MRWWASRCLPVSALLPAGIASDGTRMPFRLMRWVARPGRPSELSSRLAPPPLLQLPVVVRRDIERVLRVPRVTVRLIDPEVKKLAGGGIGLLVSIAQP